MQDGRKIDWVQHINIVEAKNRTIDRYFWIVEELFSSIKSHKKTISMLEDKIKELKDGK